jgi:hypothetical protein
MMLSWFSLLILLPPIAGEHGQIAAKVIDDRGNELIVAKDWKE